VDVHLPGVDSSADQEDRRGRVVIARGVDVHRHLDLGAEVRDGQKAAFEPHGERGRGRHILLDLLGERETALGIGETRELGAADHDHQYLLGLFPEHDIDALSTLLARFTTSMKHVHNGAVTMAGPSKVPTTGDG
jgi:hypothetical protein